MINWGGVQRDRQHRGYCDMALRCLQQGDKGWEFGGKMQQQDGNALCAIAPFAGGTMELRSLRMSLFSGTLRLSGTPWESLGISEKQGGRGRLNPGKDRFSGHVY